MDCIKMVSAPDPRNRPIERLYIVGNGFDLYHGLPSSYSEFGQFVRRTNPKVFEVAERFLFTEEQLWADFENSLAKLDVAGIVDEAEQYLLSYGAVEWSDAYHHHYPDTIEEIAATLSSGLHELFVAWLRSLTFPPSRPQLSNIDRTARFLVFNYTATLQQLYAVSPSKILHIHGDLSGTAKDIVLGHGWEPSSLRNPPSLTMCQRSMVQNDEAEIDERDTRVILGEQHINNYFMETFKPTAEILSRNNKFFRELSVVGEIFVLGHSMSDVDLPYFREIRNLVGSSTVWVISYQDSRSRSAIEAQIAKLGLASASVQLRTMDQF
jgi:hypothetical protein